MGAQEPGSTFSSKYEIRRLLGTGGMGAVYLARDRSLNRDVAVKFVAAHSLGDKTARRRLVREAQAAASLDHPSICTVHEVIVEPDGRACIVMQYVEGQTLAERLRGGPLDPAEALSLAVDIADALRAAHDRGIVHRDLKPQNIVITPSGRPKLLDFGIARTLDQASPEAAQAITETSLTGSDHVIGTPGYMSPEQLQQRPVDGRSDLFSLGAVLYECFTGRRAFEGVARMDVASQVLLVDPPRMSQVRPSVNAREDEVVARLLAKDPASRFQSAEELLGALRLLRSDSTGTAKSDKPSRALPRWLIAVVAGIVLVATAAGLWQWQASRTLPQPPAGAQQWYGRGTESIRNGAYYSARLALEEAVRLFPDYPQAYARLAEAYSELDQERDAKNALLRVSQLVPDRSRLPDDDAVVIDAITAMAMRDLDRSVTAYRQRAERRGNDAGAWLDLGRATEAAGIRSEARASYARAVNIDSQYAPAHLRLGSIDVLEGRSAEGLASLELSERLYKTASNAEGETEALLRRGEILHGLGRIPEARRAIERARTLAGTIGSRYHQIRADLQLSALAASGGRLRDAETLAAATVDAARTAHLDAVAAEGLIELATAMQLRGEREAASGQIQHAVRVAEERGANRTAARAKLQWASLLIGQNKPADAVALTQGVLGYLQAQRYRRLEVAALSILSRAQEDLERFDEARGTAQRLLEIAEQLQDDTQTANALETLAGQSATLGLLPAALQARDRAEGIHRRQGNHYVLPFDLANRAELLIRLGRSDEANGPLQEIEAGIAKGIDAYVARTRRVKLLRALAATIASRYADASRAAADVGSGTGSRPDGMAMLATALVDHASARSGRAMRPAATPIPDTVAISTAREIKYWRIATLVARREYSAALGVVAELLDGLARAPSDELEWRTAAFGSIAAQQLGENGRARALRKRSRDAWQRLAVSFKEDAGRYAARLDFVELRREADAAGNRKTQ